MRSVGGDLGYKKVCSMPVEDEASEPESYSTPTLDDLYGSLNFRDKFRLFRYGIRVDNALAEIDIHAGLFNARLRRAVKMIEITPRS